MGAIYDKLQAKIGKITIKTLSKTEKLKAISKNIELIIKDKEEFKSPTSVTEEDITALIDIFKGDISRLIKDSACEVLIPKVKIKGLKLTSFMLSKFTRGAGRLGIATLIDIELAKVINPRSVRALVEKGALDTLLANIELGTKGKPVLLATIGFIVDTLNEANAANRKSIKI